MQHWTRYQNETIPTITLTAEARVLNISKIGHQIVFTEGCDEWFAADFSPIQAIEVLEEAINWIKQGVKT